MNRPSATPRQPPPVYIAGQLPKPIFYAPKASDGWVWLREGFKLFWRNPWALSSTTLLFIMAPMLLSLLPVVGSSVAIMAMPGLAVGVMYSAFCVTQGAHPLPHTIFAPFFWGPERKNLPRLRATLMLGAMYAGLVFLSLVLLRVLGGHAWGQLEQLVSDQNAQGQGIDVQKLQQLAEQAPQLGLLLLGLMPVLAGLFLLFSRANMLSFCFFLNPAKALFFSAYSIVRSVWALLVYGLGLGLASMLAANLMLIHPFLYAVAWIVLVGVFLCSLWVGFGQCFPPPMRPSAVDAQPPSDPPSDAPSA